MGKGVVLERVRQASATASAGSHYWVLAAIVAAGLFLRTIQVGREALWADEALTLVIKQWPAFDLLFLPVDPSAGLYYVLAKLLVPDGAGAMAARALSVAFGTASILAMYALGRAAFSRQWALLAAAMLAVSPALVDYSQEARGYSLLIFLVLVSAAALLWWGRALGEGNAGHARLALFGAATVLSLYTHFTAVFWIVPAMVIGREIADRSGQPNARRAYLFALAAMAIAAVPEIVRTVAHVHRFGVLGFLDNASAGQFFTVTGETLLPSAIWGGGPASAALLAAALLYGLSRLWKTKPDNPFALAVALCLLLVPVLVWIFSALVTPIFMPRSILLGIAGLILLLVLADRSARKPFASLAFIAAALASLAVHGTVRTKTPWRPIAAHLDANLAPGDAVLVCPEFQAASLAHAMGGARHPVFLPSGQGMALVEPGGGWEARFFGPLAGWRVLGRPPSRQILTPARIWIVDVGCSRRKTVRNWLGEGRVQPSGLDGVSLFEGRAIPGTVAVAGAST